MEPLLMAFILHVLCLPQGLYVGAKSGTQFVKEDERVEESEPQTVRLSQVCSGTLVTLWEGSWKTVTFNHRSQQDQKNIAHEICKSLACGRLSTLGNNGTTPFDTCLTDCIISNTHLQSCRVSAHGNCTKIMDVTCEHHAVRLAAGADRCAGRVELLDAEQWGSVCDDNWNLSGGDVVCAQLGCGTAIRVTGEAGDFGPGTGPIHISKLNCTGTEKSLWECSNHKKEDSNYCGHKEDAGVVCSGSPSMDVFKNNTNTTTTTGPLNWTSESVTEVIAEVSSSQFSVPVLGCIALSFALLLVLLSNAALCQHYKRKNACVIHESHHHSLPTMMVQTREQTEGNTVCAINAQMPVQACVIHESHHHSLPTMMVQTREQTEGNTVCAISAQMPVQGVPEARRPSRQDSSETSSCSDYERYYNALVSSPPVTSNFYTSSDAVVVDELNHTEEGDTPQNMTGDVLDSESTSSRECYENSHTEREALLNQDVKQFYPEKPVQMPALLSVNNSAEGEEADVSDTDSTSSGEYYENTVINAETFLLTPARPSLPEETPVIHHTQLTGSSRPPETSFPNQDDSSSSSGDYENVPKMEAQNCQSSSSDSDYDDVTFES